MADLVQRLLRAVRSPFERSRPPAAFDHVDRALEENRPDIALDLLNSMDLAGHDEIGKLLRCAQACQDLHLWPETVECRRRLIDIGHRDIDNRRSLALATYETGQIDAAFRQLERMAADSATSAPALLLMIDLAHRQKDWERAGQLILRLENSTISPEKLASVRFHSCLQQERFDDARQVLSTMPAADDPSFVAPMRLELAIAEKDVTETERLISDYAVSKITPGSGKLRQLQFRYWELVRDFPNAIAASRKILQDNGSHPLAIAELARLLILAGPDAEALDLLASVPEAWHRHRRIAPLLAYRFTRLGEHASAKSAWNRIGFWSGLHSRPDLRAPVRSVHTGASVTGTAPVKLFTTVRNEMLRLPWFLDYYRSIGIREFYIIDNDSTDDTPTYLRTQDDVWLFHTADSFRDNLGGTYWINYLIDQHAADDWVLYVDVDEMLVLPRLEQVGIEQMVSELESRADEAVFAPMLDMFPESIDRGAGYRQGQNPLDCCACFDPVLEYFGQPEAPYRKVHGGASERFAGQKGIDILTKTPLFNAAAGVRLFVISHKTTPAKVSTMTGALLHFKFLGPFLEQFTAETRRADHFGVGRRYSLFARNLGNPEFSLTGPDSRTFTGVEQLLELELISDFAP